MRNSEVGMRKLIAGMKISADGKVEGPAGTADWVEAWSEDYGLTSQLDACVLGGGMYPGYERYWSAIQQEPGKPVWITGSAPTPAEIDWARFAAHTPHYVLSSTLDRKSTRLNSSHVAISYAVFCLKKKKKKKKKKKRKKKKKKKKKK